jgi:predicted dehydrogenase
VSVFARALPGLPGIGSEDDNVQITLEFAGGTLAQVSYTAVGDPAYPRERVEIIGQEAVGVIENFQSALVSRQGKRGRKKLWARDMGYEAEVALFIDALRSGRAMPTHFEESALSTLATIRIIDSLRAGHPVAVDRHDLLGGAVS